MKGDRQGRRQPANRLKSKQPAQRTSSSADRQLAALLSLLKRPYREQHSGWAATIVDVVLSLLDDREAAQREVSSVRDNDTSVTNVPHERHETEAELFTEAQRLRERLIRLRHQIEWTHSVDGQPLNDEWRSCLISCLKRLVNLAKRDRRLQRDV